MNPEEIRALLQEVAAARADGMSDQEINAAFREHNVPFQSVGTLEKVAANLGVGENPSSLGENVRSLGSAAKDAVKSLVSNPREHLRPMVDDMLAQYQGFTLGFGDDILNAIGGATGREGVGEEVKERVAQMPTRRRVMNEIGGSLLPVHGGAGVVARGIQALRGGRRVTPIRAMAETTAGSAAVGGATGAAAGAGHAEPGERREGAMSGGLLGVTAGGLLGIGGATLLEVPRAFRTARQVGSNVAGEMRRVTGRGQTPPDVLEEAQRARQVSARKGLIEPLEEAGVTPPAVTDAFVSGGGSEEVARTLQRQLRAVQSRNPNARQVLREIGEVQAGKRESLETAISFNTADELARTMTSQASRAIKMGRAEEANNLLAAHNLLDEQLRTLPGFEEFKGVWAATSANIRALNLGRKMAAPGKTPSDVRKALRRQPTDEAKEHLLDGWANELAYGLERREGTSGKVNEILKAGPGFDEKLRNLFPDNASWQEFQRFVDVEEASISLANRARVLAQAAAFIWGGTSLFGRMVMPTGG